MGFEKTYSYSFFNYKITEKNQKLFITVVEITKLLINWIRDFFNLVFSMVPGKPFSTWLWRFRFWHFLEL